MKNKLYYVMSVLFLFLLSIPSAQASDSVPASKAKDEYALVDQLFKAVDTKDLKKVKQLISGGLSPNAKNKLGMRVIPEMMRRSYMADRVEIVNYLIKMGADISYVSPSGLTMLHAAALSKMYSTVELLLEKKIDTTVKNNFGKTALFYAADMEMIKFLISKKSGSIHDLDADGNTLVHNAIGFKTDLKLLEYLLSYIDINARNKAGNTALIIALRSSYFPENTVKTVGYLLQKGADVNITGVHGHSALLTAFRNAKLGLPMIKKLMDNGAKINYKDDNGSQALHYAAANSFAYTKFLVDKKMDVNAQTNDKETPLIIAAKYNRTSTVDYLLSHGANINMKNNLEKTALNYAQEKDFSDLVKTLKKKGAKATEQAKIDLKKTALIKAAAKEEEKKKHEIKDIESAIREKNIGEVRKYYSKEINGSNAEKINIFKLARYAIRKNSLEILKYFIDEGLDVKIKNEEGFSLLHSAVFYDRMEIAKFLIESGLDVNHRSKQGRSIFVMTANSSVEMLEFLIKQGIKIDKEKESDIVWEALYYRNPIMAEYFTKQGYEFDKKIFKRGKYLLELIQYQDTKTLGYLIKNGLDIDTKIFLYGDNATLLHVAVIIGANEIIDFLLAEGANPNARNTSDKPIFSHAINKGDLHVIKALYDNGANINDTVGVFNETPLLVALSSDRIKIVHLLIEKGANVNAVGFLKNSALHIAVHKGYLDILKLMVNKGGNIHLKNGNGSTPLDEAVRLDRKAIGAYLSKVKAKK